MDQPTTHVSVDVLTLRYECGTRQLQIALCRRPVDPFAGRLALPGVLLRRGERIRQATERALAKVGLTTSASGQLITFDEPNRDPRGPTLSVATWAATSRPGSAEWTAYREEPELAFDHGRIVDDCRPLLAGLLWRNAEFTRRLTGDEFSANDALALHTALAGAAPDRGNLNRTLASLPGLIRTDRVASTGRGRPSTVWAWIPSPPAPPFPRGSTTPARINSPGM